ncbi:epoxide hydrolase [Favolaschia claudopus]|uniref:Epoxide hydrolase n=1 Tax=Favolaschia claudopus TaxID=2862362 RepID=A0AAW0EEM7_9AGAR
MNPKDYKTIKTQRGFIYSYYFSPASRDKPVLFMAHGFPTTSVLFKKEIPFFKERGYGLIVPDQLGFGGSDKPSDPKMYAGRGISRDAIDILDAEGIEQVIAVGHDWGSSTVSTMLRYFPERVSAVAFLAIGYNPADGALNLILQPEEVIRLFGSDLYAYMRFFVAADAPGLMEKHMDSFLSLAYPPTPEEWKTSMSVDGAARKWVESNTIKSRPSFMSVKEHNFLEASFLKSGMSAPLCVYKSMIEDYNLEEDAQLPSSARDVFQPVLYIAFTADNLGPKAMAEMAHTQYVKGPLTNREVEGAGHWGLMSHPTEISHFILEWLEAL